MGSDKSRSQYSGFLLSDPRWHPDNLWAAHSTYDERTRTTGTFEADSGVDSDLVIEPSGTPTADDDINVRTVRGGHPGPTGATFAWRTGGSGDWYGWEGPILTNWWRLQRYTASSTGERNPTAVVLTDGSLVVAVDRVNSSQRAVWVRAVDLDAETVGSSVTVHSEDVSGGGHDLYPTILQLPDGRLLLFHLTHSTGDAQVDGWTSTDDGATWALTGRSLLPDAIDLATYTPHRMRAAYGNGEILLLIETTSTGPNYEVWQYASGDYGHSFEAVGSSPTDSTADEHELVDCVFVNDLFIISRNNKQSNASAIAIRLGSAFDDHTLAAADAARAEDYATTSRALAVSDDETLYYLVSGTADVLVETSADYALSNSVEANDFMSNGADFRPDNMFALFSRGRLVVLGNQVAPANDVNSLNCWIGAGYSTVTLPLDPTPPSTTWQQEGWENVWYGIAGPAAATSGLADTSTGTPTVATNSDGSVSISCGAGDTAQYEDTDTASATYEEVRAEWHWEHVSGTADVQLRCCESTTPARTSIKVRLTSTGLELHDASSGLITSAAITGEIEVRAALKGQDAQVWYRAHDLQEKDWTELGSSSTITEVTGTTVTKLARIIVNNSSEVKFWRFADHVAGPSTSGDTATPWSDGFTNPGDLHGRPYPVAASAYVTDGVSIKAIDGPTFRDDAFTMEVQHEYPIEHLFPLYQSSRALTWRSSSTATDMSIACRYATGEDAHLLSDTIGIWYEGNVPGDIVVKGYDTGAGSWTTLATFTLSKTVRFERHGNTVIPDTGSTGGSSDYYDRNALKGGWFEFPTSGDVRSIVSNTEGNWDAGAIDEKRPTLYLTGIDGGEDASGTAGRIWFRRALGIIHLAGANKYQGIQVVLRPAGSGPVPPAGIYEGKVMVGPLVVFGHQPDLVRTRELEPNTEVIEFEDGTRRMRRLGDPRLRVEIAWQDGVDGTDARGSTDPDYVTGTTTGGAEPIAHLTDTLHMLEGLVGADLDGALYPAVWVPRIPRGTPDSRVLLLGRAGGTVYGHVTSSWRRDDFLGDDLVDEVGRGGKIVFEELL